MRKDILFTLILVSCYRTLLVVSILRVRHLSWQGSSLKYVYWWSIWLEILILCEVELWKCSILFNFCGWNFARWWILMQRELPASSLTTSRYVVYLHCWGLSNLYLLILKFPFLQVLCIQGFLTCRKHAERIILLVEMLQVFSLSKGFGTFDVVAYLMAHDYLPMYAL